MNTRTISLLAALVALTAPMVGPMNPASTAAAGTPPPSYGYDDESEGQVGRPLEAEPTSSPSDEGGDGGDEGGGPADEPEPAPPLENGECREPRVIPEGHGQYDILVAEAGERPGEDYVLVASWCANFRVNEGARMGQYEDPYWTETPPEPEDLEAALLDDLYEEVRGNLPVPEVATNPDRDNAAIVNVPVFISVENWPEGGSFVDSSDEAGCPTPGEVCARVTAEASLWYDPGEPDVEPFECEIPPGVPYDRWADDGDPFVQADRDETCTHAYSMRTGADDRPEEWPAQVAIRWTLTGYRASIDAEEDLGTAVTVQEIPRQVDEVGAVVTD